MTTAIGASNVDAMLTELRSIVDQSDALNDQLSALSERKREIERGLIAFSEDSGLTSFATEGMSITVKEKTRAKYDPERWEELVGWAVANDKTYLIQRRLTDAKVVDMVDNGEPLPEGLSLEPFAQVIYRRK